jgi:hypothetical protein
MRQHRWTIEIWEPQAQVKGIWHKSKAIRALTIVMRTSSTDREHRFSIRHAHSLFLELWSIWAPLSGEKHRCFKRDERRPVVKVNLES